MDVHSCPHSHRAFYNHPVSYNHRVFDNSHGVKQTWPRTAVLTPTVCLTTTVCSTTPTVCSTTNCETNLAMHGCHSIHVLRNHSLNWYMAMHCSCSHLHRANTALKKHGCTNTDLLHAHGLFSLFIPNVQQYNNSIHQHITLLPCLPLVTQPLPAKWLLH